MSFSIYLNSLNGTQVSGDMNEDEGFSDHFSSSKLLGNPGVSTIPATNNSGHFCWQKKKFFGKVFTLAANSFRAEGFRS
jgi:hypothetical protein